MGASLSLASDTWVLYLTLVFGDAALIFVPNLKSMSQEESGLCRGKAE